MARLTQKSLDQAFEKGGSATDAYEKSRARQLTSSENQLSRDADLTKLITGKNMDLSNDQAKALSDIDNANSLRDKYGEGVAVHSGSVSLGDVDPLARLLKRKELSKPSLTPGQETAEKEGAKKVSAYGLAGGAPAMQKTVKAQEDVMNEIKSGKRDMYDRVVGGLTSGFPTIQKFVAPTEKARMDRIQAAAVQNIRATDSNPAQVLIDQTLSRAYDPSASDEQNLQRITADYQAAKETQRQMDEASNNLQTSGYVMPGLAGNPTGSSRGAAPAQQPSGAQTKVISGKTYVRTPEGWVAQ